jgi:hypothetical protein
MQLAHPQAPTRKIHSKSQPKKLQPSRTNNNHCNREQTTAEINAYIAIRDHLLAEAQAVPTSATLNTASVANDFVELCLRTPPSIYAAETLAEMDVIHQRKRCEKVKQDIARLSTLVAGRC